MGKPLSMHGEKSVVDHFTAGLPKVAAALRSQAWEGGMARNLTRREDQFWRCWLTGQGKPCG